MAAHRNPKREQLYPEKNFGEEEKDQQISLAIKRNLTWAAAYEANQREDEQLRREMMAQQHCEKMGLLGHLVEVLEKK